MKRISLALVWIALSFTVGCKFKKGPPDAASSQDTSSDAGGDTGPTDAGGTDAGGTDTQAPDSSADSAEPSDVGPSDAEAKDSAGTGDTIGDAITDASEPKDALGDTGSDPKDTSAPDPDVPDPVYAVPDAACSPTRLVGKLKNLGKCPPPQTPATKGVVQVRPLFLPGNDPASGASLPSELRKYCLYEWQGDPALADELPPDGDDQDWLDQDCWVNGPLANDAVKVMNALAPDLHASFMGHVGRVISGVNSPPEPQEKVQIAFIDTGAPGQGTSDAEDNAKHACALGQLALNIACPESGITPCSMYPEYYVALDLGAKEGDKLGGFFGFQGTFAEKVVEAVFLWKKAGKQTPLILNLSVGWDERYNADEVDDTVQGLSRASVLSAREALEFAACEGALLIAAAGNQGAGPNPGKGPLYPAAWEAVNVPDKCVQASVGSASYAPLVHAVAGLDPRDELILRSREGATPRLAAPAFHAVYEPNPGACELLSPLNAITGTSVSAAVASALAAVVWSYDVSLKPAEVMQVLYDTGKSLDPHPTKGKMSSDFSLPKKSMAVKRVSLCGALDAATCKPGSCPYVCEQSVPYTGAMPKWGYEPPSSLLAKDITLANLPLAAPPGCGSSKCPSETLTNVVLTPYGVEPQPGVDPCTECFLDLNKTNQRITLALNPQGSGYLRTPILSLFDQENKRIGSYSLSALLEPCPVGAPCLIPGKVYRLQAPPPPNFRHARVEFVVEGPDDTLTSATSDLIVRGEVK